MDVVAWNADEALDEKEVLRLAVGVQFRLGRRLDEDDDVAVAAARGSEPAASTLRAEPA